MGLADLIQSILDLIRSFFLPKEAVNESGSDSQAWADANRDRLGRLSVEIQDHYLPY